MERTSRTGAARRKSNLASAIETSRDESLTEGHVAESQQKPPFTEVVKYLLRQVKYFIKEIGMPIPKEQQDEIIQEAYLRSWRAYQKLEGGKWKAFMQQHAEGAVLDYLRDGRGHLEDKWKSRVPDDLESAEGESEDTQETKRSEFKQRLLSRVDLVRHSDGGGETVSVDEVLGALDVFTDPFLQKLSLREGLISRLVGLDDGEDLHIVAKVLLGFTQEEIAESFGRGITRERISQRIREYFDWLRRGVKADKKLAKQHIYALNMCEKFEIPDRDMGIGHDAHDFDLYDPESIGIVRQWRQLEFEFGRDRQLAQDTAAPAAGPSRAAERPAPTQEEIADAERQLDFFDPTIH